VVRALPEVFDRQPILVGDRVQLRPTRPDDWAAHWAIAADPLMWEVHPAWDRYKEPVFRSYFDANLASGGSLTTIERATGTVVGASRYWEVDPATNSVEIGASYVARAHWGSGINRAVKRLMIGHALRTLDSVNFRIGASNIRSRRAIEKIGARLTGRTDVSVMAGVPTEHVIYEITREGFATGPLSVAA
jgi:RimJ/RimL family protein N-acetyltransferase